MLTPLTQRFPWLLFPSLATAGRAALLQFQNRRLRQLVHHAWNKVPFYRQRFQQAGLCPRDIRGLQDLHLLPIVNKQDLRQCGTEGLLARGWEIQQLLAHHSSGTSGTPLTLYRSWHEERILGLLRMRALSLAGVRWFHRRALVRPMNYNCHPNRPLDLLNRLHIWPLRQFECSLPPQQLLEQLTEYRPHMVSCYPGVLSALSRHIIQNNGACELRPQRIFCGGETVTAAAREQIGQAFPLAQVRETYGCMEFNLVAWQCPHSEWLHTCDEGLLVEVVDDQGRSLPPGQSGHLVGTALHSFALPLLRYQLGDRVVKGPTSCGCGGPWGTLEKVQGRSLEFFTLSGGRLLQSYTLGKLLQTLPCLQQFQMVQETRDRIAVHLVLMPGAEPPDLVQLEKVLLKSAATEVQLELRVVPEIPLGPNGKFCFSRPLA